MPRIHDLRRQGAILRAAWLRISEKHPELREELQPQLTAEDAEGYFNQFAVSRRDQHLQGKAMVNDQGEFVFSTQTTQQFGSRDAPVQCQGNTIALDFVAGSRFQAWDAAVCAQAEAWEQGTAEGPPPVACRLAPPAYRRWLSDRAALRGPKQAKGGVNSGYIDDEIGMMLGRLRAIKFHLIFWQVLREFLLPAALGKAQIGDGVTVLGTDIFLREGVIMPSAEELPLYDEWLERASSLAVIERAELKALNGTLNFGSFAIPGAQLHLRCSYRAAAAKF